MADNFRLDNYDFTCCELTYSPVISVYALRHFEKAEASATWCGRVVHFIIGLIEAIPLLGLIVSIVERVLVDLFGTKPQLTINERAIAPIDESEIEEARAQMAERIISDTSEDEDAGLNRVTLYQSTRSERPIDSLLGPYDILETVTTIESDSNDNDLQREFFVHYAAPIHVDKQSPLTHLIQNGRLDEDKYLEYLNDLFSNLLIAQKNAGVTDIVIGSFGLEEQLRGLSNHDVTYQNPSKMQALKQRIATAFVTQYKDQLLDGPRLHYCQPLLNDQDNSNRAAYHMAFRQLPPIIQARISTATDISPVQLAQNLANQLGHRKVGLLTSTDSKMIGGRWFEKKMNHTVTDELLLHSPTSAKQARSLNGGLHVHSPRTPEQLAERIRESEGTVIPVK